MKCSIPAACTTVSILLMCSGVAWADMPLTSGGNRLVDAKNSVGGWDRPLLRANASRTVAPIAVGLLATHSGTRVMTYPTTTGKFVRDVSPPHSTGDGAFMHALSRAVGDMQYANDVKTKYYDALSGNMYGRGEPSYDIAGFARFLRNAREPLSNPRLRDVRIGRVDVSIRAAVDGLATADPTADLAAALANMQIDSGGFLWDSPYLDSYNNNTVLETARSTHALSAFDSHVYHNQIADTGSWPGSALGSSGGWGNWLVVAQNSEITGEVLQDARHVPAPGAVWLGVFGMGMVGWVKRRMSWS